MPVAVLAVLAAGGCTAPPTQDKILARIMRTREIAHLREVDAGFAEGGRALVDGMPVAIADDSFWPGDRLLFGVESFAGERVERYYLLFEAEGCREGGQVEVVLHDKRGDVTHRRTQQTGLCRVKVSLLDEHRRLLKSASSEVARFVHETGVFPYLLANEERRAPKTVSTSRTRRPLVMWNRQWGQGLCGCLMREMMNNAAIADLAGCLSISPGWFEAIGLLGASMTLYFDTGTPRCVPQPILGLPAGEEALEFQTQLYRKYPFLLVNLVVVPAVGPLAMSAGIVTVTGFRAEEPDRRFVMRLLGVARGPQPAAAFDR